MAERAVRGSRMKTIRLEEPGRFALIDTQPPPALEDGQALVKIHRVGVCGTDLHAFRGRQPFFSYPRILGHELGVEVIEVASDVHDLKPGDHCAVEPYLTCGSCIACRRGKTNCCATLKCLGVHTDGGMRERIAIPAAKLHVSNALTFDQLALVETLGIGAHAVDRAHIEPNENVLVIGAGPIGLSVIQFAAIARGRVIVMDVNPDRLTFARSIAGVDATVLADGTEIDTLNALTNGDMPTIIFDASGNAASMARTFDLIAHGGKIIFVGLFAGDITFNDPNFHRREITLLASRNATSRDFQRIVSLIETGQIDTSPWITHRASFDQVPAVFEQWLDPASKTIKAMVSW